MRITSVRLETLEGWVEHTGQFRTHQEDRLGMAVDVYEEFARRPPPPETELYGRDAATGKYRMRAGVLVVETDEGVSGICLRAGDSPQLRRIASLIVGRDPLATDTIWDIVYRSLLSLTPGSIMHAIAAVDIALWDLKSKALGVPIVTLLGGPARTHVDAYAMMRDYSKEPDRAREHAREIASQGFGALKWYPRFGPTAGREGMAKNEAFVAAVREGAGEDVDILLDCWKTWDVPYTIEMAKRLGPYRIRWIEEPVFQYKVDQYAEIRRNIKPIQVNGGEQLYALWEFKRLFDAGAVDNVQPDPLWCGGITNTMKIITLAEAYDVRVIMHVCSVPLNIQISASRSAAAIPLIEYPTYQSQFTDQYFLKHKVLAQDGRVEVPTRPGLYEIDEERVATRTEVFRV